MIYINKMKWKTIMESSQNDNIPIGRVAVYHKKQARRIQQTRKLSDMPCEKNTMIVVWVIVGLRSRRRKDQSQQLHRSENALC